MQASVFSLVLVLNFLLLEVSSVPFGSQVRAKLGNKIIHLELPYQNNVFKIQKDLASATGGFLYSDGFAIYSIDANFSSASNTKLLGRNNGPRSGYAPVGQPVSDDVPPVNDLYALAGFVQLDTDTIIIVSIYQHCILGLSRTTSEYYVIAGTCGSSGLVDGPPGTGRFFQPSDVAYNVADKNVIYVSDKSNNAVRKVTLDTGKVTTVVTEGIYQPTAISWSFDRSFLLVSNMHNVAKIIRDGDVNHSVQTLDIAVLSYGFGVVEIEPGLIAVADTAKQDIQLLDVDSGVSERARCSLVFPFSVFYDSGRLYMGESGAISSAPLIRN